MASEQAATNRIAVTISFPPSSGLLPTGLENPLQNNKTLSFFSHWYKFASDRFSRSMVAMEFLFFFCLFMREMNFELMDIRLLRLGARKMVIVGMLHSCCCCCCCGGGR